MLAPATPKTSAPLVPNGTGTGTVLSALTIRSLIQRKQKTVNPASMRENFRKIKTDGFNPTGYLWAARSVFPGAKSNELFFQLIHFTKDDFEAAHLPPYAARWNDELDCLELNCQRYRTKNDRPQSDREYYPQDESMFKWIAVRPGDNLSTTDWDRKVDVNFEDNLVRFMDLHPVERAPEQIAKYPGSGTYAWRVSKVAPQTQFRKEIVPKLIGMLPPQTFFIANPNAPPTGSSRQLFVTLKLIHPNDAEFEAQVNKPCFTIGSCSFDEAVEAWAWEDKQKKELAAASGASNSAVGGLTVTTNGATRTLNSKCLKLAITILQKSSAKENRLETIACQAVAWDTFVTQTFLINDVTLWANVMKCIIPALPLYLVCSLGGDRSKNNGFNMHDADRSGEEVGVDLGEDREQEHDASQPSEQADETVDFSAALEAHSAQSAQANNGPREHVDFGIYASAIRAVVDVYDLYQKYLIPVTPKWVTELITVTDNGKPKKVPKPFLAPTSGRYAALNPKKPETLPAVVCVSEHGTHTSAFAELVQAGKGEFRVMVNSPSFASNPDIIPLIRNLTPEEGVAALDGQAGAKCQLARPAEVRYALFFLNHASRKSFDEVKAMKEATESFAKYTRASAQHRIANEERQSLPPPTQPMSPVEDVDFGDVAQEAAAPVPSDVAVEAPPSGAVSSKKKKKDREEDAASEEGTTSKKKSFRRK